MKFYINKNNVIISIISVIVILFIFSPHSKNYKNRILAQDGVLDLTNWDLQKDGTIKLDGEWEFYWNKLLTYDDLHRDSKEYKPSGYFSVPAVWNNYEIGEDKLSGNGYATFRLKVKTNNSKDLKGLKILTESTSYKIMIDGDVVATNGIVGRNKESAVPQYRPQIAHFDNKTTEFEVIVQISNYTYARGGFWHSIDFGLFEQISTMREKSTNREMLLCGAVLSMIFYHVGIYWLQRRNKSMLYFMIALIGMCFRIFFTGEYFITSLIPNIDFKTVIFIEYMTVYWGSTIWFVFVYKLYPEETSKKSVYLFVGLSVLITLIIIVMPISFYTRYLTFIEVFVVITSVKILFSTARAVHRKKQGAELLLFGIILFLATYIHDSLYYLNVIVCEHGGLIGYTIFIMLFIQAYILAANYSKSFDEVEKLSSKMVSVNKLKDEFLANTSHELRTPLHGMISITESVLASMEGKMNEKQKENLLLVISSGRRLANLVNEILDFSKLKHGDIKLYIDNVDINQIVDMVMAEQRYLMGNKKIMLINDIPTEIPFVRGDKNRIIQIVYNLLGNAVKFTISGQIIITAIERDEMIEISIEDTGIGIEDEKLDDIFKSYEQGDVSSTKAYGGTGLGLSITKKLIEIQGGQIWVTSQVSKGSKFTFSLPIGEQIDKNKNPIKEKMFVDNYLKSLFYEESVRDVNDGEFTVLIVDDDYVNLHSLVNILSVENYSVITATNGTKALEIISKNRNIDIVILDIMMPQMSGYEVCKKIREKHSSYDLPVLMLTAQNNPKSILNGFEAGTNDFLLKPFEISELKARVRTLIELKKSVSHAVQSEMAFLQAQIKPHFLYNALNTIVSFCWIDPEKAAELIVELSNYLRNSFNFNNMDKFVHIDKEIEFVQSYLAIEKARFGDKISCHYDMDKVSFMIPSIVLQPIVENAVKHGILKKDEGGNITISIKEKGEFIVIKVEDDGIGMSEDKLNAILEENIIGNSVGLRNVIKRLKHIYGYGIAIESEVGKGTAVYISIPQER